jgi:Uncharacterized protein conserved in bacteria (DUF2256)
VKTTPAERFTKTNLPSKTCATCGRPFAWRNNGRASGTRSNSAQTVAGWTKRPARLRPRGRRLECCQERFSTSLDLCPLLIIELLISAHHLRHPWVTPDCWGMTRYEVPIESVERTSARAGPRLHVIGTARAVVRHAVDLGAAGSVGFRCQQPTISELAHADGVGQFHPLVGVGIDCEIPRVQRLR